MSLRTRLFLLVLLAVVPAVAIQLHSILDLRRSRVAELAEEATWLLHLVESEQQHVIEGLEQVATTLAATRSIRSQDWPACRNYVGRLIPTLEAIQQIDVLDSGHVVRCSSAPDSHDRVPGDHDHVRAAAGREGLVAGNPTRLGPAGVPVLPFALAYRDRDGREIGVVSLWVRVDWLESSLNLDILRPNTTLTVASPSGRVLVRMPTGDVRLGEQLPAPFQPLIGQTRPDTATMMGLDGRYRVIAFSPPAANAANLFFAVGIDRASALREIERATGRSLLMIGLGLLAAFLAAWIGGHFFVQRPIVRLLATAERWRQGDYAVRADPGPAGPEMGRLADGFNAMAEGLRGREQAIRDRMEAQEMAAQADRRMASVMQSTTDAIMEIDRDWRVISMNDNARSQLADGGDLIGRTAWEAFPFLVGSVVEYAYRRAVRSQQPVEVESYCPDSGSWWLIRAFPSPGGGLIVFSQDITARKQIEVELRAAKEAAERANLAKSRFLAAASHDLRQPVQSLFLFASIIAGQLHGHPAAPVMEQIHQALDALKALLDSLLDVSRLDAGIIVASPKDFALDPLLARIAAEYAPRAAAKGLRLRRVPTRAWVRSDPALLEPLLRNLIENALKYTNLGGVVIGVRRRGDALSLEVVDSGIGIPNDRLDDIWEEFVQIGNPQRDRRLGLGLGLAIVQRLARLLKHPVQVRSQPGRGSVFAVTVPRATTASQDSGSARTSAAVSART